MYETLANRYRPQTLEDVIEQDVVKKTLKHQIEKEHFQHAMLFSGCPGTGKTSNARIFAKAINGGSGAYTEINAAVRNKVEDIRDLVEEAQFAPLGAKYRVYIVDECFSEDTKVNTLCGTKLIKDIKVGDYVENMLGFGRVTNVFKNYVPSDRLCCVTINGERLFTTVDHLFFTDNGWVEARNLEKGDVIYADFQVSDMWKRVFQEESRSYLQILQSRLSEDSIISTKKEKSGADLYDMWQNFFSDTFKYSTNMFNAVQKSSYFKDYEELFNYRAGTDLSAQKFSANVDKQSFKRPKQYSEKSEYKVSQWDVASMEGAEGWQWALYRAAVSSLQSFSTCSTFRICDTDKKTQGISNLLQSRPCLSRNDACDRGGWESPLLEKWFIERLEKDRVTTRTRVDCVEVYKRGDNDELFSGCFKDLSMDEGTWFYDLEVDSHPSYFANGVLVHNCHMLTIQAWNAFLKLLEEPPKHAIFILCTTDPQKIPDTILSRTQRYEFKRISFKGIVDRLEYVLNCEKSGQNLSGVESWDKSALEYIAKSSKGGMRSALTLLDKCLAYSPILTAESVAKVAGIADCTQMMELLKSIQEKNETGCLALLSKLYDSSVDFKQFIKDFIAFVLDVIKYCQTKSFELLEYIPDTFKSELENFSDIMFLREVLTQLMALSSDLKWETNPKMLIEATFVTKFFGE